MKDISEKQAAENGISTRHTDMENGEIRYRLIGADNSSYIRTEAYKSCWENAHFHMNCKEMYIVQRGTIYFCELKDNQIFVKKMHEGDYTITSPNVIHNVHMCKDAIVHTVKFGDCENNDWHGSDKLLCLKDLTLEELNIMAEKNI